MKKHIINGISLMMLAVSSVTLTGCMEETEPHGGSATTGQVQASPTAAEGLLQAVPSYLNSQYFSDRNDWDFGIGSMIHVRDVMLQDMAHGESDYNQWTWPATCLYLNRDYKTNQYLWNYQNKCVNTTNSVMAAVDIENATPVQLGYCAVASAYRAMYYIDMMGEYEWLPNDVTIGESPEGNPIEGLTVPIITEKTTEQEATNNPRATREEMVAFIESDLKNAETWITNVTSTEKSMPHLDVVYGLYARLYLWIEDYAKAEKYARLAIDNSTVDVMTKDEALAPTTGFNTAQYWMLGALQTKESLAGNLRSWIPFLSNETEYGYSSMEASPLMIDAKLYNRISDTDWRKLMWKAPKGGALEGQSIWNDPAIGEGMVEYASLKFRPGQGNTTTYSVANVVDIPLMRVEEMYFIEAEAAAHQDAARGKKLLADFMTAHRDAQYATKATSKEDVVEEIVFQKRVELWGEGRVFFDIKRLNYPVTRGYEGTNHTADECYNTTTRPCWMNWQVVRTEENTNAAFRGYNNPDPTPTYPLWTAE